MKSIHILLKEAYEDLDNKLAEVGLTREDVEIKLVQQSEYIFYLEAVILEKSIFELKLSED